MTYEARHRRLLARLAIVVQATIVVDLLGTVAIYFTERHTHGTEVKTFGDALFFTTVQLLTVSSQLRNPLTTGICPGPTDATYSHAELPAALPPP